jgi:hypothetical protein
MKALKEALPLFRGSLQHFADCQVAVGTVYYSMVQI